LLWVSVLHFSNVVLERLTEYWVQWCRAHLRKSSFRFECFTTAERPIGEAMLHPETTYLASDEEFDKSWELGWTPTWSPCQHVRGRQIYSLKKMFRDGFREF
jgi:hypothetical protein